MQLSQLRRSGLAVFVLLFAGALAYGQSAPVPIVPAVRRAIADGDFQAAEALLDGYRAQRGVTPEMLEALSWLGRGALAAGRLDAAERYAQETHVLALQSLKTRGVDDEPQLPIALGAAIEVQAQAAAARGERSAAVHFLRGELSTYAATSLYKRLQKNVHLLSLEGERAPALELSESLGPDVSALADLEGRVVLLFFWAHWCADCKIQGPILENLLARYEAQGLSLIAPTQPFGYAAGGRQVSRDDEVAYIAEVIADHYRVLRNRPVPLSEVNHRNYGVSTTPTIVMVGRDGRIALYHPGRMTAAALESHVQRLLEVPGP